MKPRIEINGRQVGKTLAANTAASERNNRAFDTVLFSRGGYLVGRVRGLEFWTDEKRWALRFRGVGAAMLLARTISAATVPMNYFDDAVDPAVLRNVK